MNKFVRMQISWWLVILLEMMMTDELVLQFLKLTTSINYDETKTNLSYDKSKIHFGGFLA